jgi:hypothetical protein
MTYLTLDDFSQSVQPDELQQLISGDAGVLERASATAWADVASILRGQYDLATGLTATGAQRDALIVRILVDKVLFYLARRLDANVIPEQYATANERAELLLDEVRKGLRIIDWPKKQADLQLGQEQGVGAYGSQRANDNHMYDPNLKSPLDSDFARRNAY